MFIATWYGSSDVKTLSDLLYLAILVPCVVVMFCMFIPGPALIYDLIRYHICWQYGEFIGDDNFYMCVYKTSLQNTKTIIIGSYNPSQRYTIVVYDLKRSQYQNSEGYMYDKAFAFFNNKSLYELYRDRDSLCKPSYYVNELSSWGEPKGHYHYYTAS